MTPSSSKPLLILNKHVCIRMEGGGGGGCQIVKAGVAVWGGVDSEAGVAVWGGG